MTKIICLANSWKHGDRCIAGIEPETGDWIRPVSSLEDGRVPDRIRLIGDREPALLDLLEIPLASTGPDFEFESENRSILPGEWQKIGEVKPTDILQFCDSDRYILHNSRKYVTKTFLQAQPVSERRTLQLIYAAHLSVEGIPRSTGNSQWKGTLVTENGHILKDASITDPVFVEKLEAGCCLQNPCLVTVSLGMPHRPPEWEGDDPCWKLIAGVIELSQADSILVEMKRLGWTIEQGRNYLQQTYGKRSRQQLTDAELIEFLNYLKFLS